MPAPSYTKRPRCMAKSKQTGEQCKNTCVPGKRVCRFHGGLSSGGGAPKNSKNALRTGAHETILAATMTPEEQAYLAGLDTNPLVILRENLKMLKLRELRIMQRIQRAREGEARAGQPTGERDAEGRERRHPALVVKSGSQTAVNGTERSGTSVTTTSESYAEHIANWEKGLSDVQDQIRRTSDSIARIEAEGGGGEQGLEVVLNLGGMPEMSDDGCALSAGDVSCGGH